MPGSSIWSQLNGVFDLPLALGIHPIAYWLGSINRLDLPLFIFIAVYLPLCPAREIEGKVWGTSSHFIESSADALQLYPRPGIAGAWLKSEFRLFSHLSLKGDHSWEKNYAIPEWSLCSSSEGRAASSSDAASDAYT